MMELMSNEQGGLEYERYYEENMVKARKEWMEETSGDITFDDWLDGDFATEEDCEYPDEEHEVSMSYAEMMGLDF